VTGSFLVVVACGLALAIDDTQGTKPMTDAQKIQGTWALKSAERNGKPLPNEVTKQITLIFAGDKLATRNEDRTTTATFKLHPDQSPKGIDMDMDGNLGLGIYQLDGDDLKIVHGEVGDPRPKDFDFKGTAGLTLLVLTREKS
jgi:uncharacterized protein (TIGR03067 family)